METYFEYMGTSACQLPLVVEASFNEPFVTSEPIRRYLFLMNLLLELKFQYLAKGGASTRTLDSAMLDFLEEGSGKKKRQETILKWAEKVVQEMDSIATFEPKLMRLHAYFMTTGAELF